MSYFNIGAACGTSGRGFLRTAWGWSAAFAVAGLSMLLALAAGLVCYRWLIGPVQQHKGRRMRQLAQRCCGHRGPLLPWRASSGAGLLFTAVYEQTGQSLLLWARLTARRSLFGHSFPASGLLGLPGCSCSACSCC